MIITHLVDNRYQLFTETNGMIYMLINSNITAFTINQMANLNVDRMDIQYVPILSGNVFCKIEHVKELYNMFPEEFI
jgi:hypothetical protein